MNQRWLPLVSLIALLSTAVAQGQNKATEEPIDPSKHYGPSPVIYPPSMALVVGGSDSCATPDAIVGSGPFTFDNTAATTGTEGQVEALCLYAGQTSINLDVWFVWTAGFTGAAQLFSCGGTTMDSRAAIWPAGACPADGTSLACNDDACGLQTRVTWNVTSGTQYLIQFGKYGATAVGAVGTFQIVDASPPAWDGCAAPIAISGAGPHNFDTQFATTGAEGQSESLCGTNMAVARDIWYAWTSTFNGPVQMRTCTTTTLDTKAAVYPPGACPTTGTAIACADDGCGSQTILAFTAALGTTYLIQLGQDPTVTTQGGTGTFTFIDASPPANDSCVAPVAISGGGPHTFNTLFATTGTQGQSETLCGTNMAVARDTWYAWTSSFNGPVQLRTCNSTTLDTKAAVYPSGGCPTTGNALACADDGCGSQTILAFTAALGTTYLIQLGQDPTVTTQGGTGTFTFIDASPPANDSCVAPATVSGAGPHAFNTLFATTGTQGQSEALCGTNMAVARDQWFEWTATFSGPARARTCAQTTLDTKLAVYPAGGCPASGSALACNDDACASQSAANWNVTSGASYLIQLGQDPTSTTTGGTGTFSIVDATPPSNDSCATPLAISGSGPFSFDTSFATTGSEGQGESLCLFFATTGIGNDTWFVWTPAASGTATLSFCTLAGGTDTKAAVYDGTTCPSAAALACDDDACDPGLETTLTFTAACGQSYLVQVGKYPTTATVPLGTFTLSVSGTPCGPTGTPFCFGDGTGAACPCGNIGSAGNGCANSVVAAGANLTAVGTASISSDSVVLQGSGMPNATCLYFQGTTQLNFGMGNVFGDGLRCAGGTIIRLGTKLNSGGASQYPASGDPSVSVRGNVTVPGTRTYQVWYRNAAAFCTSSTFNLSNGVELSWI